MSPADRFRNVVLAVLAAGVWVLALDGLGPPARAGARQAGESKKLALEELTVERINVVAPDGSRRIVLANRERFPLPMLKGKEWPRSIHPAGIVFYGSNGDECGGIGLAEVAGVRKNLMIFDYANSEAVGIGMTETDAGYCSAGLTIAERMPLDADIEKVGTSGPERVSIANENGTAQVVLADEHGKPRLRLAVERDGRARIEFLDAAGQVVQRLPQ